MDFSSLNLDQQLLKAVAQVGYQQTTPIQAAAIPAILANKDVMAGAQTGTGKTAAFALPLLHNLIKGEPNQQVRVLVLTPTRELAQQVHKSFEKYAQFTDLNIGLAYGGVSINPQIAELKSGVDVLIATPGRLLDHLINGSLTLTELNALVFDEADRMLDLGFKDEINNILKRISNKPQTLLFSATFDDAIFKLSKTLLDNPELIEVSTRNTATDDVEQIVYTLDAERKRELLSYLIGKNNWQQVLVFTRTKQDADLLAQEMVKDGIPSQAIHGDKSQGARDKSLAEFKSGKLRALVATDVAARGIDIAELKYVINYQLPHNAEDYIHRIGRTGRAGNQGHAISLVSPKEEWLLTAVEKVLNTKLLQQWYPGYEPDLTRIDEMPTSRKMNKKNARKQALGGDKKNKSKGRGRRGRRG